MLTGWPSIAASASMPPTPQPSTPRPLTIVVCESVPTTVSGYVTGNDTNTVMYELLIAARTDEKLKVTLQAVLVEYAANIHDVARALPGADQYPPETFGALVATLTNVFDGAAIVRAVLPLPEIEDARIALLTELLADRSGRS